MKKLLIRIRTSIKLITLFVVSSIIIVAIFMGIYKPIYSVTINGEMVGYSASRIELEKRISNYIHGSEDSNVAFVQIDASCMPEYTLCFLKRGRETNDDEIYEMVKNSGVPYYDYYAITVSGEEKLYVKTFDEANSIVNTLTEKNSKNAKELAILQKYDTKEQSYTSVETAVVDLFENTITPEIASNIGRVTRAGNGGSEYKQISIAFVKPITANITSRFGSRWGTTHKGIDYGAPTGTNISAAAEGTVTFAGWNSGGYGYLVIISHGNGVQTYYGHCSQLLCKVGDYVYAGDVIAKVGNTGDSQGSHLHFEIRVNDVAYNPEYYV